MGIPHYHLCFEDCPDGLSARAVARSIPPEPVVVTTAYEPSRDHGPHTPGAGWALAVEMFGDPFIGLSAEALAAEGRRLDEALRRAGAVPTREEHTEENRNG